MLLKPEFVVREEYGAVPKVMSVALIEPLVEMTATLNVVVSINSTTVMQTYWNSPFKVFHFSVTLHCDLQPFLYDSAPEYILIVLDIQYKLWITKSCKSFQEIFNLIIF